MSIGLQEPREQVVLILVGLVGSGKSTFARALEQHFPNFRRCNQDDLGSRRKVEALARKNLEQGCSVCIDRTNFDESQREHFINIAHAYPGVSVWALVFDTPYEVCASRLRTRMNHPTITSPEMGMLVLERFASEFRAPTAREGFDCIHVLRPRVIEGYTHDEITRLLHDIRNSQVRLPPTPRNMQFFRGDGASGGHLCDRRDSPLPPPS